MKFMITVTFPVAVGNRYRSDPAMRRELEALFTRVEAESIHVGVMRRVVYLLVDTDDPALLGDIQSTLANLAESEPTCDVVVDAADFVRVSNALADDHHSDRPTGAPSGAEDT